MSNRPSTSSGESNYWLRREVGLALMVEGTMNPGIFHPQWFVRENLLRSAEAETATIEMATNDYALFRTQDFTTEVSRDGLTLLTRNEAFEPALREIFSNIFRLLKHTPLRKFTISRFTHWKATPTTTSEQGLVYWENLLPLKPWNELLHEVDPRGIAVSGLAEKNLNCTLAVEPSSREGANVYVGARYTWDLPDGDSANSVLLILDQEWDIARAHTEGSVAYLLGLLTPPAQTTNDK